MLKNIKFHLELFSVLIILYIMILTQNNNKKKKLEVEKSTTLRWSSRYTSTVLCNLILVFANNS